MKNLLLFIIALYINSAISQTVIKPTNSFLIEGKIKKGFVFNLANSKSFKILSLGDISTLNHLGKVKSVHKQVSGISLKSILEQINLDYSKPKELYSFYLILEATDGYRVVLSYNEINKTDSFYILTGYDGKNYMEMNDRVELLELTGRDKGHIYIKGLTKIEIRKEVN